MRMGLPTFTVDADDWVDSYLVYTFGTGSWVTEGNPTGEFKIFRNMESFLNDAAFFCKRNARHAK